MTERKPLEGIKVLDFSAVYAGPICARMLADCGADVVKIETPGGGDVIRGPRGSSRVHSHFNAGKRSISIDLKSAEGQQLARDLMADADIVIENFRPGVMRRFGLDYESVKGDFPGLVYCSISGFGQDGPYVERAAYAPIAHAASGFDIAHVASQGDPGARPPIWGIMIADMLTGSYAFGAIQTAMLGCKATGRGDYIDVSMIESMMMLIPGQVQAAQVDDAPPASGFHPITVKDGFVMVCIVSEKNMRCLCDAIERPDMKEEPRYQRGHRWKNIHDFIAQIEAWSSPLTAEECETRLNEAGVPCSTYNAPDDLFAHPQILARQSFRSLADDSGEYVIQNAPFKFASADITTSDSVAALGEHNEEVLVEKLNLSGTAIQSLRERGVIGS